MLECGSLRPCQHAYSFQISLVPFPKVSDAVTEAYNASLFWCHFEVCLCLLGVSFPQGQVSVLPTARQVCTCDGAGGIGQQLSMLEAGVIVPAVMQTDPMNRPMEFIPRLAMAGPKSKVVMG